LRKGGCREILGASSPITMTYERENIKNPLGKSADNAQVNVGKPESQAEKRVVSVLHTMYGKWYMKTIMEHLASLDSNPAMTENYKPLQSFTR